LRKTRDELLSKSYEQLHKKLNLPTQKKMTLSWHL